MNNIKKYQQGAVLIISLIFLMVMTLLGITAMQGTTLNERMSNNVGQMAKAFEAAEAGLRAGELFINSIIINTNPFDGSSSGLHQSPITPTTDIATYWLNIYDWTTTDSNARSLEYSDTVGDTLDNSLSSQPRYVIERLNTVGDGERGDDLESTKNQQASNQRFLYRVTARGTGGIGDAVVILQSTYIR